MTQMTEWIKGHPSESTCIGIAFIIAGVVVIVLHREIHQWMKDRRDAVQYAESYINGRSQ